MMLGNGERNRESVNFLIYSEIHNKLQEVVDMPYIS